MRISRVGWVVGFALACATSPRPPAPAPVAMTATEADASTPTPTPVATTLGREPLRPHRSAALVHPRERSAAAFQAAAEAASRAGVLDVAAYWWAEAHALAPSPALAHSLKQARDEVGLGRAPPASALQEARAAAGFGRAAAPPAPLDRELERALRAAVEAHAWDRVLALTEPALAAAPHHDLYFWAGDALWQQGHEVAARRMWSRARMLLRAAGQPLALDLPELASASQLVWSAGGLAFIRQHGDSSRWLELWGDELERPWRRQYIASDRELAWTEGGATLAEAADEMLGLRDPTTGAELVRVRAHARPISRLAAAASAPVVATHAVGDDIKIWTWPPGVPKDMSLTPSRIGAGVSVGSVLLALDPAGQRLVIAAHGQAIELVELATGARRTLAVPAKAWQALHLLDHDTLLAVHGAGVVQRVSLVDGLPGEPQVLREVVDVPYEHLAGSGQLRPLAVSATGKLAVTCDRGHLLLCGERADECHTDDISAITAAAYAPDDQRLAYVYEGYVLLHELATARRESIARATEPRLEIVGVAPDGGALAIDGPQGLAVWDTRSGARRLQRERGLFLGFSPDGATVVLHGVEQPGIELHPLADGPLQRLPQPGNFRGVHVGFARDGRRLAISAGDELAVWDLSSGTALWREPTPDGAWGLTFSARDELIYETARGLQVRDAAGRRRPRTLPRTAELGEWSVAPGGAQIFACIDHGHGSVLLDVRTGKVRRRWPELCGGTFVSDGSVLARQELQLGLLDLRTGLRREPGAGDPLVGGGGARTHGAVVVARIFDRRGSLTLLDRDGRLLADVHPRADLGWFVVTATGAVDGDPGAFLEADSVQGDQRYPASFAWDGAVVPGLLPRLFAGEAVSPPVPVAGP